MKKFIYLLFFLPLLYSCSKEKSNNRPERRDLIQAVYASGKLFPLNHYTVISKFPGYVGAIHVKPGDLVRNGQKLISIRNEVNTINTGIAKNQLELARQHADENGSMLSAIRQEVAIAKTRYELDSLNFVRASELMKQNAISRQAFDQARTTFDIAAQNYRKAKDNLSNTRNRLRIELLNAQRQVEALESVQKDYDILSAIDGKVYDVLPKPGDLVSSQTVLLDMGDSSHFEVELAVDETDISLLQNGQSVVYSIDAYRGKFFKGRVEEIFPKVNSLSKTSRIKASFENPDDIALYSGMSVEANILIREVKNALVIPKELVKDGNKVKVKGEDQLRTIKTGAEDLQFVEVLEGITEKDQLEVY